MLLKPKIDYGCEVYASESPSRLKRKEPLQNATICLATGAFQSSPINNICAESGYKPLSVARDMKMVNLFLRCLVNPIYPLHNKTVHAAGHVENDLDVFHPGKHASFVGWEAYLYCLHSFNQFDILPEVYPCYPLWSVPQLTYCDELFTVSVVFKKHLYETLQ